MKQPLIGQAGPARCKGLDVPERLVLSDSRWSQSLAVAMDDARDAVCELVSSFNRLEAQADLGERWSGHALAVRALDKALHELVLSQKSLSGDIECIRTAYKGIAAEDSVICDIEFPKRFIQARDRVCRLLELVDRYTKAKRKRGRPKGSGDTDRTFDRSCWRLWMSGRFNTFAEAGKAKGCTRLAFKQAIDRERKRRNGDGKK